MAQYKFYSGSTSGTPAVHDANTDLARLARSGYIANTGSTNSLTFEISSDGTNYDGTVTLAPGEVHNFDRYYKDEFLPKFRINKIRVNQVSSATTYKVYLD